MSVPHSTQTRSVSEVYARSSTRERVRFHLWVVVETLVLVVTLCLCAIAAYVFFSGSFILKANRDRLGVSLTRSVLPNETIITGSFVTQSPCTLVDVFVEDAEKVPEIYIEESQRGECAQFSEPMPYTFSVPLTGKRTDPVAVYLNGDRMPTTETISR